MSTEPKKIELDVRPILLAKQEPFKVIMEAVDELTNKEDTLVLHATFNPEPLLKVLKGKGFTNSVEKIEEDHWIVTFVRE
jgi:uncharacterized protein (DUF2249 family)